MTTPEYPVQSFCRKPVTRQKDEQYDGTYHPFGCWFCIQARVGETAISNAFYQGGARACGGLGAGWWEPAKEIQTLTGPSVMQVRRFYHGWNGASGVCIGSGVCIQLCIQE
jgi:hypothetical protein